MQIIILLSKQKYQLQITPVSVLAAALSHKALEGDPRGDRAPAVGSFCSEFWNTRMRDMRRDACLETGRLYRPVTLIFLLEFGTITYVPRGYVNERWWLRNMEVYVAPFAAHDGILSFSCLNEAIQAHTHDRY